MTTLRPLSGLTVGEFHYASSIIESCGGPAWVTGMGECGDKISDRTEQRPLLTFRSSARVAFRGSLNNELTGRRS
jgi:hypothetical protein